jgi:lipopolysaccharide assembly outer membrane protein LptD (OstA)
MKQVCAIMWSFVACGVVAIAGCRTRAIDQTQATKNALAEDAKVAKDQLSELKNVVVRDWELSGPDEKGRPLWSLSAKEARLDGKEMSPTRATLLNAKAQLFRDGKLESRFQAARIEFISTPQGLRLQMSNGVNAQSVVPKTGAEPVLLQAPRIDVSVKTKKLYVPASVRISKGKGANRVDVSAQRLTADTGLSTTTLSGGVKGRTRDTTIEANSATWNWKTEQVSAKGKVHAKREGTDIRGESLQADARLGSGVLTGDVHARSARGSAQASRVNFNWKNNTLISHDVTLIRDDGTMRAGKIDTDTQLNGAVATGGVTVQKGNVTLTAAQLRGRNRLSEAQASGGVTLRRGDLVVEAARAQAFNLTSESTLRVIASGNVRARNAQGQVRAENVTWGNGQVVASGGVTMRKDGSTLSGSRLQSDDRFLNATLSGSVRGTWKQGGTVEANELRKNGNKIIARNGVRARRDGAQMRANRLDSTVDMNNVVLAGNVEFRTADGATVRAPTLRFDRRADKVYGSGGVTYSDPSRGLRGKGKTLVVSHVTDAKRREAVLTETEGSSQSKSLNDLKLF